MIELISIYNILNNCKLCLRPEFATGSANFHITTGENRKKLYRNKFTLF